MTMKNNQRLRAPDLDPIRAPIAILPRCMTYIECITDVTIPIVSIGDPVDTPDLAVILLYIPVPHNISTTVCIEVKPLIEIVDMATSATVASLRFNFKKPVARRIRITNTGAAVVSGTLSAMIN